MSADLVERFAGALYAALIRGIKESPNGVLRSALRQMEALRSAGSEEFSDAVEDLLVAIARDSDLGAESLDELNAVIGGLLSQVGTYLLYTGSRVNAIREESIGVVPASVYAEAAAGVASDARVRGSAVLETIIGAMHNAIRVLSANESGVHEFYYDGPDDDITRPWCQRFVGQIVTLDDLRDARGEDGRDPAWPIIMLGGYRCRHTLIPQMEGKRT